ncbi:two-component system, OmpR family, phosphate regulon sensor histidine kinase PhoR [Maribacter orientalis]|uniref:histidine kinase n=1 Tax=Maribacter orientalis TaxID=228957 RepID=A0A1H7WZ17_9FLAO|nr:HAMP domain-containing sensor histidine kinase [Maribacter orientalis]SEM26810.1 two-component system, OmpR family, phosphate regulon sensor histidine kinase PhoR [Maribacter orientalis]
MLKKRNIYIAIFFISIIGLAVIQYQYLRIGLNLAKLQFNSKLGNVSSDIAQGLEPENQLTFLIASALKEDTTYFTNSIDSVQDASRYFLNDYITEKLVNNGIDTDFTYTLHSKDSSFYLQSPKIFEVDDNIESYPIELIGYLPKEFEKKVVLELQFKNLNSFFLSKLNGLTLPSILFILGICIAVIWVLKTYYWQRKVITTTNEFINNLTHELKTPVFSIGLATKILEESALNEQKPILGMIRQQVKRLTVHIDKVLELGNLESSNNVLKLEKIDFRPYLLKLCEEFATLIAIEEVQFTYTLQQGCFLIKAEVFHLENSINNILDNAKKYSVQPIITLNAYSLKNQFIIEISDNGKGISEEEKKKIFLKYYRVNDKEVQTVKGYGLGLSYVKKVIEKHKGKVLMESEKGKGTKISLIIPLGNE